MINIPSTRDDPHYRYKMPELVAKVEGRGNGIKTNIVNTVDIARALKRPPSYVTKWFGCELGALSNWYEKEEKAIVNGAHQKEELLRLLDKFIEKYVLCPNCHLPEIDLVVKNGMIGCKCNACPHRGDLDNVHRIAVFIAKNPPDGGDCTMGKKNKKSKEERQAEKAARQRQEAVDGEEGGEVLVEKKKKDKKDKSEKKERKEKTEKSEKKEKKSKKSGSSDEKEIGGGGGGGGSDGGGGLDDSANLSKTTKIGKSEKKKKDDILTFDSPDVIDVIRRFHRFIQENEKLTVDEFFSEIRVLQVSSDFDSCVRFYVGLHGVFGLEGENYSLKIKSKIPYLSRLIDSTIKCSDVLMCLEMYTYTYKENMFKPSNKKPSEYSLIIKIFFDEGILEEDEIIAYYEEIKLSTKSGNIHINSNIKNIHKIAVESMQQLLVWMKNCSDDDDTEDDSADSADDPKINNNNKYNKVKELGVVDSGVGHLHTNNNGVNHKNINGLDENIENINDNEICIDEI
eukprot:GHVR01121065.1.p1 GENE.GHVR01121065.1~~GHVR01121065.1.p1  ORF type:complete len:512 (-),score=163.11 GHVR01121065.1:278-1813(-)